MKKRFFFREEVSSASRRIALPFFLIFWFFGGIIIVDDLMSGNYTDATYWIVSLIFMVTSGYLFYRYKIPVSVEVVGQNLYVNNSYGKHLNNFLLCEVDMSSLIPVKESDLKEAIEKNKRFFIRFKIKGERGTKTEIGRGILRPGYISMKKLIEFQHWVIDHIKENCPEEVYREAMKYWIDWGPRNIKPRTPRSP